MNKRTRARRTALQALYQWQMTAQDPHEITNDFNEEERLGQLDRALFDNLLAGVINSVVELDEILVPHLDRGIAEIDPVERAVLRLAAFELRTSIEVPWKVVVNEAVELAHMFGAESSHRFINGVLDKVARELRPAEMAARR